MNTAAYILAVTLQALTPQGVIDIPINREFRTEAACFAYYDSQLQSARKHIKGAVVPRFSLHCEVRK